MVASLGGEGGAGRGDPKGLKKDIITFTFRGKCIIITIAVLTFFVSRQEHIVPQLMPESFDVEPGGIVDVMFTDGFVLRFVPPFHIPKRHQAIRNVQLLKAGERVAQYDGVIAFCSKKDPNAATLMPRAMALGEAAILIGYWEAAVRFVKAKHARSRNGSSSEHYVELAKWAKNVGSISEQDLKTLKRNTENERRNHERQSS